MDTVQACDDKNGAISALRLSCNTKRTQALLHSPVRLEKLGRPQHTATERTKQKVYDDVQLPSPAPPFSLVPRRPVAVQWLNYTKFPTRHPSRKQSSHQQGDRQRDGNIK